MIFKVILTTLFFFLGGIHFYWLFGGKWGLESAIPTKDHQTSPLQIPKFATLIVALVLLFFGLIYLVKTGFMNIQIPSWIVNYGSWFIPSMFLLRAIGDFKYVGFFRKIKNTTFAKADAKIFSPLCLFISIVGFLIAIYY